MDLCGCFFPLRFSLSRLRCLLFLGLSCGSFSCFSAIICSRLPLPRPLAATLPAARLSPPCRRFGPSFYPSGVFPWLRLLPLRPCGISFFPSPFAFFFGHYIFHCCFSSFMRLVGAVSCYCFLVALLWCTLPFGSSPSPCCVASFPLQAPILVPWGGGGGVALCFAALLAVLFLLLHLPLVPRCRYFLSSPCVAGGWFPSLGLCASAA